MANVKKALYNVAVFLVSLFITGSINVSNIKNSLLARQRSVKKLGKFMNNVSAENKINKRKALLDFIGNMLLLHHTAAAGNNDIGIFTLLL